MSLSRTVFFLLCTRHTLSSDCFGDRISRAFPTCVGARMPFLLRPSTGVPSPLSAQIHVPCIFVYVTDVDFPRKGEDTPVAERRMKRMRGTRGMGRESEIHFEDVFCAASVKPVLNAVSVGRGLSPPLPTRDGNTCASGGFLLKMDVV